MDACKIVGCIEAGLVMAKSEAGAVLDAVVLLSMLIVVIKK